MTIICEPQPEAAAALVAHADGLVRATPHLAAAAQLLAGDPTETLLVIGAGVDLEQALSLTVCLRDQRPTLGVILVRDDLDVDVLTRAMRAGVREVVAADDLGALAEASRRSRFLSAHAPQHAASDAPPAPAGTARTVTVFSAKGGSGKTTLATNLAVVLNAGGARRVCLVDLDLAFGDVAISLQLEPKRTIADAMQLGEQLDVAKVASVLTPYRPGLDCVLAPVEPGDAEKMPVAVTSSLLRVLAGMYEYVVVDTPSQFSEHVLAAFDASQDHVLLTAPEVPALKNLRLTLDMLDLLSYGRDSRAIVLNRSDASVGLTEADVQRVVKAPVAGHVPSSRDVPASINRGVPLAAETPDHPVSQGIRSFAAEHLSGEPVAAGARQRRSALKLRRRVS